MLQEEVIRSSEQLGRYIYANLTEESIVYGPPQFTI